MSIMKLIYVNEIGNDYKNQKQYEFIFSDSTEFTNDEWFVIPASSSFNNKSPDVEYINIVGLLKDTDLQFELIQNSDYFGIIDAVDGVVALAWEKYDSESENDRLCFRFGETIENVSRKLKLRNYYLYNQDIKLKDI
jgi:hypothetical protein